MKKKAFALFFALLLAFTAAGCGQTAAYAQAENWAYLETDKSAEADVFFICPTVYSGEGDSFHMSMGDEAVKSDFLGAVNMEKGIYDQETRFFAPYYRQAGLNAYELPQEEREACLSTAYEDVKEAFTYYLEHYNDGQPIIPGAFVAININNQAVTTVMDFAADTANDAQLEDITLTGATISFDPETYTYSATATNNSLKIEATAAQATAQIAIQANGKNVRNGGTVTLTASELNPITVTVKQGNATRVYTLNITGAAAG